MKKKDILLFKCFKKNFIIFLIIFLFVLCVSDVKADDGCFEVCDSNPCHYYSTLFCYTDGDGYIPYVNDQGSAFNNYHKVSIDKCINNNSLVNRVNKSKCDFNLKGKVSCGSIGSFHKKIPELTSWFITIIEVAIPVILIIMGVIDFIKALSSQKEDEIKKGQQIFIKRLIISILVFFVVVIVKLLINFLSNNITEKNGIIDCIECFINNKCS